MIRQASSCGSDLAMEGGAFPAPATESDTERLRPMMEQACRETFRELVRIVSEPAAGSSESIESLVSNVSTRLLRAASCPAAAAQATSTSSTPASSPKVQFMANNCLCGHAHVVGCNFCSNCGKKVLSESCMCGYIFNPGSDSEFCRKCGSKRLAVTSAREDSPPPVPQLQDVVATPWVIWRERKHGLMHSLHNEAWSDHGQTHGARPRANSRCDDHRDVSSDTRSRPSRRLSSKELPLLHNSPTLSPGHSGALGDAFSDGDAVDDEATPSARVRRAARRISSSRRQDSSTSTHAVLPPAGPIIGETPTVCRQGLTMASNTMNSLQMQWQSRPRVCLIVVKKGDHSVHATMLDMARFLSSQGVQVVLEPQLLKDEPNLKQTLQGVRTFSKADKLERSIDLVITIGGDGTLTWAVSMFNHSMPPVLAFAAGSLGFLTPFPLESWIRTLTELLDLHRHRSPQHIVCRMRLRVSVRRHARGHEDASDEPSVLIIPCLNEVLIHRGASGSLAKLIVGVDGERVTTVQGDGLILATPTGSTAYSLAAGGSMVHPSVPGILLTPVSPHSLSFRPALLPDSAVISVEVPLTARCGAAVSVDGKDVCVLSVGDSVEVAMSPFPVPTICHHGETRDWFTSVQSGLQWNTRTEQKPM